MLENFTWILLALSPFFAMTLGVVFTISAVVIGMTQDASPDLTTQKHRSETLDLFLTGVAMLAMSLPLLFWFQPHIRYYWNN